MCSRILLAVENRVATPSNNLIHTSGRGGLASRAAVASNVLGSISARLPSMSLLNLTVLPLQKAMQQPSAPDSQIQDLTVKPTLWAPPVVYGAGQLQSEPKRD